jgi:putative ABC transport system ATP-binding protein
MENVSKQYVIHTERLAKIYYKSALEIKALADITIKINRGEFVAIMGPSGAGKSTLLHILGCLDQPTSGNYFLAGSDVSKKSDKELSRLRAERIGIVFQTFNLLPNYTVLENVKMPFLYFDKEAAGKIDITGKALSIIEAMGMGHRLNHYPMELSGGEQQRAAIARALVTVPEVLLADEPTGNLDTKTGSEIIDIFRKLNRDGATVIMVTHNMELSAAAHRRIYIKDGILTRED